MMIRTRPDKELQAELLETGELLDYYISLEGRTPAEKQVLDGVVYKLMGQYMRLMNERSNLRAKLMEVNARHPVPVVLHESLRNG